MKKKLLLKGIICIILSITTLFSAFSAAAADAAVTTEQQTTVDGLRYDPYSKYPVYSGYTPDYSHYNSYQYQMFMDILELYTETHLYEFTTEQAQEAFIMKLMKENPELMKMFINTLLQTMDPYSAYYEAGTGLASGESYSKAYGIRYSEETAVEIKDLGITAPGVYVTDVIKDSPAEKAGIRTGDKVVSIEGISAEGLTMEGVQYLMLYLPYVEKELFDENGVSLGIPNEPEFIINETTGKKEYPIHMELKNINGEIYSVKLLRDKVYMSNISYRRAADHSYSYIKIDSFMGENTVNDFREAIEKAKKESGGKLIIDLRDNPGGVAESAFEMANMLIEEEGRILAYDNSRRLPEPLPIYSTGGGYTFDNIAVLVNENSASAAEAMAMMLNFNCGATLVGTQTYGKAVGQQGYVLSNGDMFTITSMELLDPLKRSYHNVGLTPDVEIDLCMAKADFPRELEYFGIENYAQLSEGSVSDAVMGLEKRLELLGILRSEYVDGTYDSVTTAAIKSFKLNYSKVPAELLDEEDINLLDLLIEKCKNNYYYFDSQLEVAQMSFLSKSQAKRRAKELTNASRKTEEKFAQFLKAEEERLLAEEKLEQERLEQEAANAQNADNQGAAAEQEQAEPKSPASDNTSDTPQQ